jgi:hypothetical protein
MSPETVQGTKMLTALVRLRGALQTAVLPLELPGVADNATATARWSTRSRTTSSRA